MATSAQIEANRPVPTAQDPSKAPNTPQIATAGSAGAATSELERGKSRFNALKSGLHAQSQVIPGEDAAERRPNWVRSCQFESYEMMVDPPVGFVLAGHARPEGKIRSGRRQKRFATTTPCKAYPIRGCSFKNKEIPTVRKGQIGFVAELHRQSTVPAKPAAKLGSFLPVRSASASGRGHLARGTNPADAKSE